MRLKHLILTFGYDALSGLCGQKGWGVPSREEIVAHREEIEHPKVWVCDVPTDPADRETHGYVYDLERDILFLTNKSFMEPAVVITSAGSVQDTSTSSVGSGNNREEIEVDFDLLNYEYGFDPGGVDNGTDYPFSCRENC